MKSPVSPFTQVTEDPRSVLARWANSGDEWVRHIAGIVLSTGRAVTEDDVEYSYQLFRQSKALDKRTLPPEAELAVETVDEEAEAPLLITKLCEVDGVNALVSGAVIEPHEGLTILYGENGTGKTGYSRIFKALAGSRSADQILGDIEATENVPVTATLHYTVGGEITELAWQGEFSRSPFTRMSIFDSPAVNFHVDDDLDYVYVPTVLSIFNHIGAGVRLVQQRIEEDRTELAKGATSLIARFPKDDVVYPQIETLGASTDIAVLAELAVTDPKSDDEVTELQTTIAALQSNSLAVTLTGLQRQRRVLAQTTTAQEILAAFDAKGYNASHDRLAQLKSAREAFRTTFFAAADLPAEPDDTWEAFVASGATYQAHLVAIGSHDDSRCLYCRQPLDAAAGELVTKYSDFLLDKVRGHLERQAEFHASTQDEA